MAKRSFGLTKRERDRIFRPYAVELGNLLYAWNNLHETLGVLFWKVSGISNGAIAMAIWHSANNDRAQREMLRAAAEQRFILPNDKDKAADVKWLLNYIDHNLSGGRNEAVHAPLSFFSDEVSTRLLPYDFMGNPRAKGLKKAQNLLQEIMWHHQRCEALRQFVRKMERAIGLHKASLHEWPKKPPMPLQGEQKISKRTLRAVTGKGHRLRLRVLPRTDTDAGNV